MLSNVEELVDYASIRISKLTYNLDTVSYKRHTILNCFSMMLVSVHSVE